MAGAVIGAEQLNAALSATLISGTAQPNTREGGLAAIAAHEVDPEEAERWCVENAVAVLEACAQDDSRSPVAIAVNSLVIGLMVGIRAGRADAVALMEG